MKITIQDIEIMFFLKKKSFILNILIINRLVPPIKIIVVIPQDKDQQGWLAS